MVLPIAARHGAQVLANCRVDGLLLEQLPGDGRDGRTHRVTGVVAWLTDSRGTDRRARRDPRAPRGAGRRALRAPPASSCGAACRRLRRAKGSERAVGERFSTHATITFCGRLRRGPLSVRGHAAHGLLREEVRGRRSGGGGSRARPRALRAGGHAEPSAGPRPARAVRVGGEPPGVHEALQPDHDAGGHVPRPAGRARHVRRASSTSWPRRTMRAGSTRSGRAPASCSPRAPAGSSSTATAR